MIFIVAIKLTSGITIFDRYELETFIAFFILFAGLATILFSFALGVVYKTSF